MSEETAYNIDVNVKTDYLDIYSQPDDQRYVFSYHISISNLGNLPAQLLSRHWVITDANGKIKEVRGEGVIGEQPTIEPGETYSYSSSAVLETPIGCMEGSYDMRAEDGKQFKAYIEPFRLSNPSILH